MKKYYDGEHDTPLQMAAFVQSQGLPWSPTQCTDGFIHVETQIDTNIPEFEFSGRDDDQDSAKAKQREFVCRYIMDENPIDVMNTRNERRMNLYGLAGWKVAFDLAKKMGRYDGNIEIGNPKPQQLFWDPNVTDDIDEGEYFALVYRMHKMKVARAFAKDLKRIGKTIQEFAVGYGYEDTEFLKEENEVDSSNFDYADETLQITEWYFRQPEAGKSKIDDLEFEWEAGDIGLVLLINQEEIRYVPKYWRKTDCDMYPLSVYCKVPNDDTITGKSEIELIKDYIDSTDRALAYAQLNDAFMANDVVIVEEGALADDCELQNVPGGVNRVKQGRTGGITRLPGLSGANRPLYESADKFKQMMQNTNGNFDIAQGNPSVKAKTAFEIAALNDNANTRQNLKKADRTAGWKRLIKLIDYTALEHFDDDRLIYIGAKSKDEQPTQFNYNSDNMRVLDGDSGEFYYPTVDVKMHIGDGLKNSKAFTISALKELAEMQVTPQNYKFIQAYISTIDIPQKVELNEFIEQIAGAQQQPSEGGQEVSAQDLINMLKEEGMTDEELDVLEAQPEIIAQVAQEKGLTLI